MNQRSTKIVINIFTIGSALLIPVSTLLNVAFLSPTIYAGTTLVFIYFSANPKFLNASPKEWKHISPKGPAIPIALYLGALLMIIGFVETGFN